MQLNGYRSFISVEVCACSEESSIRDVARFLTRIRNVALNKAGGGPTALRPLLPILAKGVTSFRSRSEKSKWLHEERLIGLVWVSRHITRAIFKNYFCTIIANGVTNKIKHIKAS